jgi:hypothetical protein
MKPLTSVLLLSALGSAHAGDGAKSGLLSPSRTSRGWTLQSISAGPAWRSLGSLDYKGGSNSANFIIPSVVGGDALNFPAIGASGIIENRLYNDGFVNVDGTSSANGDTWYWGYDTASQASGNNLLFSATGTRSAYRDSAFFSGDPSTDETLEALTPQIDLLLSPPSSNRLPFDGLLVSLWAFSEDSNNRFSNFNADQTRDDFRLDLVDTYDISAISPLIGAPYTGSIGGPGPIIPNLPSDRRRDDVLIGGDSADFSNSISTSLDLDGYSLAVGPTWQGEFSDDWAWQASAGITFNLFKWSARETETLSYSLNEAAPVEFNRWQDSNSGSDFRLGAYAKGELIHHITDDWFAKGYLQLEIADSIEIDVGESQYEFKPRGFALGLSIGHSF